MDKFLMAMLGALIGAVIAGAAFWYVLSQPESPRANTAVTTGDAGNSDDSDDDAILGDDLPSVDKELDRALRENSDLRRDVQKLADEKGKLEARVKQLEAVIENLPEDEPEQPEDAPDDAPEPRGNMRVTFGAWGEMEELRDADWADLGKTIQTMHEDMKEVRKAMREGEAISPALQEKLGRENRKLVQHALKVMEKLPTNASVNGEFSHPINLVNFLAAHLEGMGEPLSDAQLADLARLGEEYEKRWKAMQEGYDETTYNLQKLLDEGELKEWFREEMFRVTTPRQKAAAVPAEIEGVVGLDLYSAGLIFQMSIDPVNEEAVPNIKDALKSRMESHLSIERTMLDNAEYLFDEWVIDLSAQLQPKSQAESEVIYTRDVIAAGKAQLSALIQFEQSFVTDEDQRADFRALRTVLFPQVVEPS